MQPTIVMIHTISGLVPMMQALAQELMPEVRTLHIADEGLLRLVLDFGGISPSVHRRVCENVLCASEAGANVVLVTCSSISPCVDVAQKMVPIPVLKIDEPMADKAAAVGDVIGVLATSPTALKPTSELVQCRASLIGKQVTVKPVLCREAYEAMFAGDIHRHDQIITEHLFTLMEEVDVVVLAQGSMARAAEALPRDSLKVPVLSSLRSGMARARHVVLHQ